MDLSMTTVDRPEKISMRSTEYRKVIKPLLERRRRARINSCLDELKALILETTETENADTSKLEKADILELTVQHLRNYRQRQHQRMVAEDKFKAGFAECAHQVSSFLTGEDHQAKSRLMSHLASCIDRIPQVVVVRQQQPSSEMLVPTPPPSPISPISRKCVNESFECNQPSQSPCSNFSSPQHPTDYVTCSSPDVYGQYRKNSRSINLEFSDVYYSSKPSVYARKINTENGSSRPWRPW